MSTLSTVSHHNGEVSGHPAHRHHAPAAAAESLPATPIDTAKHCQQLQRPHGGLTALPASIPEHSTTYAASLGGGRADDAGPHSAPTSPDADIDGDGSGGGGGARRTGAVSLMLSADSPSCQDGAASDDALSGVVFPDADGLTSPPSALPPAPAPVSVRVDRSPHRAPPSQRFCHSCPPQGVSLVYETQAPLHSRMPPSTKSPVYTIVLTGGPCGGKTSSLETLSTRLKDKGFAVYCCPEIATTLISNGCRYPGMQGDRAQLIAFEVALLRLQMMTEASFLHIAASVGRPSVVLLDRGMADPRAYLPDSLWAEILPLVGLTAETTNTRYDLVLHLETAAKQATEHYTRSNNAARTETVEEACTLDDRVWNAWTGHERHLTFDNSTDFQGKLERVYAAVAAFLRSSGSLTKAEIEAAVATAQEPVALV